MHRYTDAHSNTHTERLAFGSSLHTSSSVLALLKANTAASELNSTDLRRADKVRKGFSLRGITGLWSGTAPYRLGTGVGGGEHLRHASPNT